jgi:hypothetical protein
MSEDIGFGLGHLAAAYVIGTAAGLWLFREVIKEKIVTATLDTLVEQGYLFSWLDSDGVTQITKWSEVASIAEQVAAKAADDDDIEESDLDIIERLTPAEIEAILDELIQEDEQDSETDDTP